jgi:hypothetical protein
VLGLGLPFSNKKIILLNTKQDGTGGSSIGIPSDRRREKPRNPVPNHLLEEKNHSIPNHFQ